MVINPIGKNVAIKPDEQEQETKSGFLKAQNGDKKRPETGIIIALGEEANPKLTVDAHVVFRPYSPDEVQVDEQKVYLISSDEILAIIP